MSTVSGNCSTICDIHIAIRYPVITYSLFKSAFLSLYWIDSLRMADRAGEERDKGGGGSSVFHTWKRFDHL